MQNSCEINEGQPQNAPKADEGHPSEDTPQEAQGNRPAAEESVREEARGSLGGQPAQFAQEPKENTLVRHLYPEEIIRGVDELERLREEIRRVRNKFVMMHW
uniref:transcription elongation factor A protein-like 8 n=1 Tax=Jaculus jaculus TaxID=51337 RepID=UPI001E1B5B02|nr:transcription elongation factor A protein-like 8 [Jaculus jaculus]